MDSPSSECVTSVRSIRSFVRRQGRMTRGQQRALNVYWEQYGLEFSEKILNLDAIFGRQAPRILEIGFGMGNALIDVASRHPERDYLGVEVYQPGVGSLLSKVDALQLTNVRASQADAVKVLTSQLASETLDGVCLFFPDPWPKKRHHKRRIVQAEFSCLIRDRLKVGGVFHIATDWEEYAYFILDVLANVDGLTNMDPQGGCIPRPEDRPLTKFERRGQGLGHEMFDIKFSKDGVVQDAAE